MHSVVQGILAKYESKSPPDGYPSYGDTIEFTDEANGRQYTGVVLRHHWASPLGSLSRNIWEVQVTNGPEGRADGNITWSVRQSEITKITRKRGLL